MAQDVFQVALHHQVVAGECQESDKTREFKKGGNTIMARKMVRVPASGAAARARRGKKGKKMVTVPASRSAARARRAKEY